jgi:hypothetical protein
MVAVLVAVAVALGVLAGGGPAGVFGAGAKGEEAKAKPASLEQTMMVEKGPAAVTAAEEAYDQRAFPAKEIPFELTLQAQKEWSKAKIQKGKGKVGEWGLIGPSESAMPGLLTFSGADYVTSGRITALAIDPSCDEKGPCRLWVGAAGGGIWRTKNALAGHPNWDFVSGSFPTNAIGALTYDAATGALYAGTGEPNASGDSEAGMGLMKSTDGGETWTLLPAVTTTTISGNYTGNAFLNRAISAIVVDPTNPNILYVGSGSAVRGVSSVSGAVGPVTPLPGRGVYKSTDGGQTFTLLNSATSGLPFILRGVTDVAMDPWDHNTIYAGQFGQGVFRSTNGGTSWTQIFAPINPANPGVVERDSIAVAKLPGNKTRIYLGAGEDATTFQARLYRTDDATAASVSWTNLTTAQNQGYCTGQCWYDNVVFTPPGRPDTVYLGGSYDYPDSGTRALGGNTGKRTNGRTILMSSDAGASFTDLTRDATGKPKDHGKDSDKEYPNGMHPDQHAVVVLPSNPDIAFFGSDGGLVRTNGKYADTSAECATRGLTGANLALCQQLLSRVPDEIISMNTGLSTLQFQSLSVNPADPQNLQGGTQDNGTWETEKPSAEWPMTIWGDGGQSGFSSSNPALRFNTFFGQANDGNFRNGDPRYWVVISGDILSSPEGSAFYPPVIADPHPANGGTIFQGSWSVWRTQNWGGNQAFLEANCSEFTANAADPNCGDFERIGPAGHTDLRANDATWGGADRAGGNLAAIERAPSDTGTMWVATGTGRIFVSQNASAPAGSVTYTRIDTMSTLDPTRFVTGIFIDPANPNHAWISYSGYNASTPTTPGHVFEVTFNPAGPSATWKLLDGSGATALPDTPATDVVRDTNGDLYVSSDFGVMRLASGSSDWGQAGTGLPMVEVAGLTIAPAARKLYAATHGRSAWALTLP